MDTSPINDPWELIAESLTGSISAAEELQLQQWLSVNPENKKKFLQIQEMWKNGLEDYRYYRMANGTEAWKALQVKMSRVRPEQRKSGLFQGEFVKRHHLLRNLSIAAAFIGVVGLIWFILNRNTPEIYMTAFNEQKKITLLDGSVITMQQQTRIEVPHRYNKSGRTIIMGSGKAEFDVVHHAGKPFTVELGTTRIKDIGTRFIIRKEDKLIHVAVTSGKVAFELIGTKESREISAGAAITFDIQYQRFGNINAIESSKALEELLVFEGTPLSEVIVSIQKVYGRQVVISDSIADKKFTAKLYGMSCNNAIQVICRSLGLEYSLKDSIYTLRAKTNEQP
jgi:transmembrane sensor